MSSLSPLLEVRKLVKHFPVRRGLLRKVVGQVRAVDGVSFGVASGETLALVGETGSGKTTTGRCVLRLIEPTSGEIRFEGQDILGLPRELMRKLRRKMQIIFQDPQSSLNPRMKVGAIVGEPLVIPTAASVGLWPGRPVCGLVLLWIVSQLTPLCRTRYRS